MQPIGLVVIGRNEGERLRLCLASVRGAGTIVYVDSGSTDGSVETARSLGADVVELDTSIPFSAARARNAGFIRLTTLSPDVRFVHFIDGDCEMLPGWIDRAVATLEADHDIAATCGRLRERFPEASIYNRMCDMEWNELPGEVRACGGIALYRADYLRAINGFDPTMVAGEEPELCYRLRERGWKIIRLPDDMALHDAAITRFGQWWKRMVRGGHAYAEGAHRYGRTPEHMWVRECRSIWSYAVLWPILIVAGSIFVSKWCLILLAVYPLLAAKVAVYRHRRHNDPWPDALLYGRFVVIGKWAQLRGQIRYWMNRARGKSARIIEYKSARSLSS